MPKIAELAKHVRSKNAGPFWVTLDLFFDSAAAYDSVKGSAALSPERLAEVFDFEPQYLKRFDIDDLQVIKLSFPRPRPQGHRHERDMHAGQQYTALLECEV